MTELFFVLLGMVLGAMVLLGFQWVAVKSVKIHNADLHRHAELLLDREAIAERARRLDA